MSILKIYKTQLTPAKNALLDNIEDYLSLVETHPVWYTGEDKLTYTSNDFQYVKPDIDIKIKINVDKNSAERIKDKYPEVYEKLMALFDDPNLGKKVKIIALPVDVEVPDWILEFVDYNSIINDNLKNFPLESIGLRRFDNDSVNYSNIINL